jgi:hypothetical protein
MSTNEWPAQGTDEWYEKCHDVKEQISEAVTSLVNELTKDLPKAADEHIRDVMTEQYRFWR